VIPRLYLSPTRVLLTLHHCSTRMALTSSRCCTGARRGRTTCPRARAAPLGMHELRCIRRGLCKSTWAREHMARRGALPPLLFCRACGGANAREKRQRGRGGLRGGRRCTGLAILGHGPAARSERACGGVIWLPRTLPRDSEKNIGVDLCVHRRLCSTASTPTSPGPQLRPSPFHRTEAVFL
jgi:hypothetical protein